MKPNATLLVLPNPYFALDANGMPACAVRYDPERGRPGVVHFVGAEMIKQVVDTPENRRREPRFQRRTTRYTWSQVPITIPNTPLHIGYVRSGALLAVDRATARECGIWFVEPGKAIAQTKAREIAAWRASHGEDPPTADWPDAVKPKAANAAPAENREDAPVLASPFEVS